MPKKIAPDKWRHFYTGILMGAVLQGIGYWLMPGSFWTATLLAFAAVAAISYGFELFSKITGMGVYDFMDAVASAIGGVIGMAVTIGVIAWVL